MLLKLAKLDSGMMVVGSETEDGSLTEAYMIQLVPNPQNQQQISAMILPFFMPLSEERCDIDSSKILTRIDAPSNIESEYIRIKSNIQIASPSDMKSMIMGGR